MGPLAFVPEVGAKPQNDALDPRRGTLFFGFKYLIGYQSTVTFEAAPIVMVSRIRRHLCLIRSSSSRVLSCRSSRASSPGIPQFPNALLQAFLQMRDQMCTDLGISS
jgi:hypothetical protein